MTYYRISKKLFLIFFPIMFILSCSPKIQTIPEVTDHLRSTDSYTFNDDVPVLKLLSNDSHFVLINGRGTISKIDIVSGQLKFIYQLKFAIHPDIYAHGDLLALRDLAGENLALFDMKEMTVIHNLELETKGTCIAANRKCVVWRSGEKIVVYPVSKDNRKMAIDIGEAPVLASSVGIDAIYIPTNETLYAIDTSGWKFTKKKFPVPCHSGILLDNGYVYYGSQNRELIKLKLANNAIQWKFPLTKNLTAAPIKTANHIVCTPEDQNIYFISTSGTLDWWQKLDSTRLLPPVPMGDNIAVFLFPPESPQIRYFNFEKRESYSYKLKYLIFGAPIYFAHDLFILKGEKEGTQKKVRGIARIGNRYEVDIKTDPKRLLSTGKSIKFILKPINLIEPAFDVSIFNSKKESVFNKKILDADKAQFNWIPEKEGDYEVTVAATTGGGEEIKSTQTFTVLDTDTILLDHYLQLQQECSADVFLLNKKSKNAKNH